MKSDRFTYPGIGVAVGGLLGWLGVFTSWYSFTVPISGGELTVALRGTEDWSGQVAVVAGTTALLFGAAYVLLSDPGLRRISGSVMGAASAVLLVMTLWAALLVEDVVPNFVVDSGLGALPFASSLAPGLAVSFIGGVLAFTASLLAIRETGAEAEDAVVEVVPEAAEGQVV
jgi:hypothetical protein